MKYLTRLFVLALFLAGSSVASAAYTLSNTNGGDGSVFGPVDAFILTGSDNGVGPSGLENTTFYTDTVLTTGALTFNWVYLTRDLDGASFDPAGYVLNSILTQLSGAAPMFSGVSTVNLTAGDVFGWYVHSVDSLFGSADLQVSYQVSAVPEPETYALMLAGLGLLGAVARRRKQKIAA